MVKGFESFRDHFKGYEDCYTLIGGTACDILMNEAALEFRATRDIDMILLIENRFEEFAAIFWDYIKKGGYHCGWRNSELPHFYRFTEPKQDGFPSMIELFSKRPGFQMEHPEIYLTPLPVSEEISSLSAIMLDDDYYNLMLVGRQVIDGVSVLRAIYLIVFKAKAWLELRQRKEEGSHVNERDLRKHKNDVFRLFMVVDPMEKIALSETISNDMSTFIGAMEEEKIDLKKIGIQSVSGEEILESLRKIFTLQ